MRLCNQQIGTQLANQFAVNVIKRLAGPEAPPNLRIDFPARNRDVEGGSAAGWKPPYPFRAIALMRAPYQHFAGAQGADDFRGAGQKRNNTHVMQPAVPARTSG